MYPKLRHSRVIVNGSMASFGIMFFYCGFWDKEIKIFFPGRVGRLTQIV